MLSPPLATRILLAIQPVDLRLGFNGLYGLVKEVLKEDPTSGHLFAFTNRRHNRLKLLWWDGSGLWSATKRLERGGFAWPRGTDSSRMVRPEEWSNLVHGLEVVSRSGWYRK
jgi:transposase